MRYNEKYDLYLDDDLIIYYWDNNKDKLMQRTLTKNRGYLQVFTKIGSRSVHRIIYETFVGPISDGYEIDHINTVRDDNRLENLRLVTHKENCNNNLSRKHRSHSQKGNTYAKGKPTSEFGRKFFEHYGTTDYQNHKLYDREHRWYRNHNNKCRWE